MDLSTFELCMLGISILEGGIFIGVMWVSIKFLIKEMKELKEDQKYSLDEYKKENKENIELLREDMKKYNNVLERLAVNEREIQTIKHVTEILQDLYNSLLEKITTKQI